MNAEPRKFDDISTDAFRMAEAFVPLSSLKPAFLQDLLQHARKDYLCAGTEVFERGAYDCQHFYLINGRVKLIYASGHTEILSAKDQLHPMANEFPRPCRALADTDCTLIAIDSEKLDRILSWSQISEYLYSELSARRELDEDMDWIRTVLDSNLFFKVPPVNAEQIFGKMNAETVLAGDVIIRQGEIGNCCFFIKEGKAQVTRFLEDAGPIHLADIGVGRCFGEDALVYETLRNATVTMATDGVLVRLDKTDFKQLLLEPQVNEVKERDIAGFETSPVYIDVRTQEEYEEGHLAMSVNIPLNLLSLKKRLLKPELPYIFYCNTGRRSRAAAHLMSRHGFNAMALRDGLVGSGMQYQLVVDRGHILKNGEVVPG